MSLAVRIYDLPDIGHYLQVEAPDEIVCAYFVFRDGLAKRMR